MSEKRNLPATRDDVPKFRFAGVDWPCGPSMLALPNDRMRAFVVAWTQLVNIMQRGAKKHAAQLAGYDANADNLSHQGMNLLLREDVQRAVREMDERRLMLIGSKALRALEAQIENPTAKGHVKSIEIAMDHYMPREALVRHTVERVEDKSEIFMKLVEQRRREGRTDSEIRHELQQQGDPAAISAADYYLMRVRPDVIDATAVDVTPPHVKTKPKAKKTVQHDDDW